MAKEEIRFEIKEYIGTIATKKNGWTKELNLISWNDQPPKYDLRDWDSDHAHMSRGVTLFSDEMRELIRAYNKYQNRKVVEDGKALEAEREKQYWSDIKLKNGNKEDQAADILNTNEDADQPVKTAEEDKMTAVNTMPVNEGCEESCETLF